MSGILYDESIDGFPIINTYTGLVDKVRDALATNTLYSVDEIGNCGWCERYDFIREFGYFIPTKEYVNAIKSLGRKWVSIGCGRGYMERILRNNGIDIIATDIVSVDKNPYFECSGFDDAHIPIELMDGYCAACKYPDRSIISSWMPMDSLWAIDVIAQLRDNLFVFIGERHGGCTGHNMVHDYIDTECDVVMTIPHANFVGIHDGITVYKLRVKG